MKRRHFSPVSPTVAEATAAKKNPLFPCSEEKKLDTTVLQYQNQKLGQQLEIQKFEYSTLQNKFNLLKDDQKYYDETLNAVREIWEQLTDEVGSLATRTRNASCSFHVFEDSSPSTSEESVLSRLLETGTNESSGASPSHCELEGSVQKTWEEPSKILENIVSALNKLWTSNNQVTTSLLAKEPDEGSVRQLHKTVHSSCDDIKSLRAVAVDLQIKHRSLLKYLQSHRDTSAKFKSENMRLSGELESITAELRESKHELSVLKSRQDSGCRAPLLVATLGSNHIAENAGRDRDTEYNELESAHQQMLELASTRLSEIQSLHEKRKELLVKMSDIQAILNVKIDSSSIDLQVLHDQLGKCKSELDKVHSLLEKLQVEKETLFWREKEVSLKVDMAELYRRVSAMSECKIAVLEKLYSEIVGKKAEFEAQLQEDFKEPGRKGIISQFKNLVSSLPKTMETMQAELAKHKEDASEVFTLKAKVESFTRILTRKEMEMKTLRRRSTEQVYEMKKLQLKVQDLKHWVQELKKFLQMFRRETSDSSETLEARDAECKAWARVQGLKSALDERKLEFRVKAANEAEAMSQQRLANAEAEIAELRRKLDSSTREILNLKDVLKSKCEEGEAYLSEIESIGQAYEDLQTENQNLLQQIMERDDYNIKLLLDSVKDRQTQEALQIEIQNMTDDLEQANISVDFYNLKVVRLEDQTKNLTEQVGKLVEDSCQCSTGLENVKQRLLNANMDSLQLRQSVNELTSKSEASRKEVTDLQICLEEERFENNRIDEDIEVKIRKAAHLKARHQGPSLLEKLQQELEEYRGILKCGICKDRQKEVVIAKCYHLVCNACVQKVLGSRHRKCPVCGSSFGPNDIKPIYI